MMRVTALSFLLSVLLVSAQEPNASVELGMIASHTSAEADAIRERLQSGADFAVLAREKSIDPSSVNGGYLGRIELAQLRPELQSALAAIKPGEFTAPLAIRSGSAIYTVFSKPPRTQDLDAEKIKSQVTAGVVKDTIEISGQASANAALAAFAKPNGWDRDLKQSCAARTNSYDSAVDRIARQLVQADSAAPGQVTPLNLLQGHAVEALLYLYTDQMEKSIAEWEKSYKIALASVPGSVPYTEEALGVAHFHLAEEQNGVYRKPGDLGFYPPKPGAHFAKPEHVKIAIDYFDRYLAKQPDSVEVKWLLNLAYMTIGGYPGEVPKRHLLVLDSFKSEESIGKFRDIAPEAGLDVFTSAGGVVVDDFDNDGLLDVITSSMDMCEPLHFFHNNGNGTFSDRTAAAGLSDQLGGLNIVKADYNNDGCLDLLVLRGGWEFANRKSLLRNNCDGTFTDVTEQSGLANRVTSTQTAAWADIDNDGYLDLFVGNENAGSQLFHNRGDGTFEDISHSAGVDKVAFSKGVAAADYDNDGFVDFYVSNVTGANYLYHNNGNKTFTEIGRQAGVQAPFYSFATWFFDYDNDGWPDLFVDCYYSSMEETIRSAVGMPVVTETLKLYRNLHNGAFEDVTAQTGIDKVVMPMGAGFGDVDNDGFLDIYLGMGQPSLAALMPHLLFRNKEGRRFVDITASSGTGDLHKGHGIVFADLDRSGHESILAGMGGAVPSDKHAMRVYANPGNDNGWINIRLTGVKTNRSGVGVQIKVTVQNDGHAERSIYRTVGSISSFGGNPLEQHIGLGHGARIVAIDIHWPTSNTNQHFTGVEINQFIAVKEFEANYTRLDSLHAAKGIVVSTDAAHRTLSVSCEEIPGYMAAMEMEFNVRDAKSLTGLRAGTPIQFNLVSRGGQLFADDIAIGTTAVFESEPMAAGQLTALNGMLGEKNHAVAVGGSVPDFTLTDQAGNAVRLSQLHGKVVALTFGYSRCPNPTYCYRLSNNLGRLAERFHDRTGKDLVLLTIMLDPEHDQGETLKQYADSFKADASFWHFVRGSESVSRPVLDSFGVHAWPVEGLLTHTLHTAVIDRQGRLALNIEGNQFSAQQLGDLVQDVLNR